MDEINKIDIKDIYKELINRTKGRGNDIIANYRMIGNSDNNKEKFTDTILNELEDIVKELSNDLITTKDHKTQKEYYRIDLISWTQRCHELDEIKEKNDKLKNFNLHFWDLDIAIEHENNDKDWMDEVIKLLYINCPRRLVIGYVDRRNDGQPDKDISFLEFVVECINKLDPTGEKGLIKKGDQFAIMLGTAYYDSKVDISNERYYDEQINYQLYFIEFNGEKYEYISYV